MLYIVQDDPQSNHSFLMRRQNDGSYKKIAQFFGPGGKTEALTVAKLANRD